MVLYGASLGGAELQFMELARFLAPRHEITLISLGGGVVVEKAGLPPSVRVQVFPYGHRLSALWGLARACLRNIWLRPDAVITTAVFGNAVGLVIGAPSRARLVSLQTVSKAIRSPRFDRMVLRRFHWLVAGSNDIRGYLLDHGQVDSRIEVINNWVDFSARGVATPAADIRDRYEIAPGTLLIGCIGRMHPQKAQEYLIRAYRRLRQAGRDVALMLVGGGDTLAQMRAEAEGISPPVIFAGEVTGQGYNDLMAAFDIYAQPSRFEGMPRTLLDAMYLRRPIVATAVNGNCDAIQDGENGFLVPSEDDAALAAALERLISDPGLRERFAAQAAADARRNFSMEQQLGRIEGLL